MGATLTAETDRQTLAAGFPHFGLRGVWPTVGPMAALGSSSASPSPATDHLVNLGKSPPFSEPPVPVCKMGMLD